MSEPSVPRRKGSAAGHVTAPGAPAASPGAVPADAEEPADLVNDFAFKIGTPNGTGSASANGLLMKSIFRMGVPVSGKNLFPSNIQGLPTWYEIRVSRHGFTGRTPVFDLMVAMNPASYDRDVHEVRSGGWVLHDSTWPLAERLRRDDVTFLGVPLARMCVERFEGARERILLKNIVYVGVLGALLDLEMDVVLEVLRETYGRKKKLLDANLLAVELGHTYATKHFDCPLPIRVERMDANGDKILIDGNTASALGCVYAGATVAAWYPITPSTSLVDAFTAYCRRFRKDPETGRNRFCIVQAEDELAAAGVVVGAGWAGARAFTATSGPGISLMSEFIGLAYYAEIPAVIFDVQRAGPSTGMPTRTQQADLVSVAYASHGDTKHIVLFPADPAECFDFAVRAFDLAERFQTPVFVLSDLDIGMNDWLVPRLRWDDDYRPDRGKVLSAEALDRMERFYRYLDVDGDGIAARTLPGVDPRGAFFTRGSGHDRHGGYTEDAAKYSEVMERIARKVDGAAAHVPAPVLWERAGATLGLVSLGGCDAAVLEAVERLAARGVLLDYLRVRGFPFGPETGQFLARHPLTFVVEQNRDAQLRSLLLLETAALPERLASVRFYGGLPLSWQHVVDGVLAELERRGIAPPAADAGGGRAGRGDRRRRSEARAASIEDGAGKEGSVNGLDRGSRAGKGAGRAGKDCTAARDPGDVAGKNRLRSGKGSDGSGESRVTTGKGGDGPGRSATGGDGAGKGHGSSDGARDLAGKKGDGANRNPAGGAP